MSGPQSQREKIRLQNQAASRKRTTTLILAITGVVIVALLIYFIPRLGIDTADLANQNGFSVGDPNAPVKVENFSDFRCRYCRQFSETIEKDLIRNYVDTGKVYLTFKNYPFLTPDSTDAAEAASCAADQNKFWQYKTLLFKNNTASGAFAENSLLGYARDLKLDMPTFQSCYQNKAHQSDIQASKDYAASLGIDSTPQFNVNGTVVTMDKLMATIDAALAVK